MSDDLKKIISENLKYYRTERSETIQEISESIDYSPASISEWENGKKMPRTAAIDKLAEYYGIEKSKLLNKNRGISNDPVDLSENRPFSYKGKRIQHQDMAIIRDLLERIYFK